MIEACLLGGAVGDALGAEVEFLSLGEIRAEYGPGGVTDLPAGGGMITDDTQMTLFTAEGLIRAHNRQRERGIVDPPTMIGDAYLRWLATQRARSDDVPWRHPGEPSGWLITNQALFARRAPGMTCLGSLGSGQLGRPERPLNDSKGCGGVMRVAPIGLIDVDDPFGLAVATAALTHGHPSGFLSAGAFAAIVADLTAGIELAPAVEHALVTSRAWRGHDETTEALRAAVDLAAVEPRATPELVEQLGAGWAGEEALAIAVYCALTADSFESGMNAAVNHSGDADSTGAIAGNLLGLRFGLDDIPRRWLDNLVERDLVRRVARDLADHLHGDRTDLRRYPPW